MPAPIDLSALHRDWSIEDGWLVRRFTYDDFASALAAANAIGALAERANHHPDLNLGWGYLVVRLRTHDADALTAQDQHLAQSIDRADL